MQTTETYQAEPKKKWIMLDCRFCNRTMQGVRHRATQNERTGQVYIETLYQCPFCDFWTKLKIPRKLAATIVDEQYLPVLESTR